MLRCLVRYNLAFNFFFWGGGGLKGIMTYSGGFLELDSNRDEKPMQSMFFPLSFCPLT